MCPKENAPCSYPGCKPHIRCERAYDKMRGVGRGSQPRKGGGIPGERWVMNPDGTITIETIL